MRAEVSFSVEEIIEATAALLLKKGDAHSVESVVTDSRKSDSASLFIALPGERFDGHDFLDDLMSRNSAAMVLVSRDVAIPDTFRGTVAKVDATLAALGKVARLHRDRSGARIIGITGTNGKTTTKEMMATVFSDQRKTHKNVANYNNEIGVPFTLLSMPLDTEVAIVEMGMNHPGEISRLSEICRPDIAVITSIGEGHLEFLGSLEAVARAKSEIVDGMSGGALILNADTPYAEVARKAAEDKKITVYTYGEKGDYRPSDQKRVLSGGTEFTLQSSRIFCPLAGSHNMMNCVAVLVAAQITGLDMGAAAASMRSVGAVEGRGAVLGGRFVIIDDSYNANPASMKASLETMTAYSGARHIAVLGGMKELGDASEELHRSTGEDAARAGCTALYVFGDEGKLYCEGARRAGMDPSDCRCFDSRDDLTKTLRDDILDDDVVLVKGSRGAAMEDVVRQLSSLQRK